jgi:hypothetical protein
VAATGEDSKASISEPALNEREGTILMGLQRNNVQKVALIQKVKMKNQKRQTVIERKRD